MNKYARNFKSVIYCPVCNVKGENIEIEYVESFNDEFNEECELYDCKCLNCGFIFQDYV